MVAGWRYRAAGVLGTLVAAGVTVAIASHPLVLAIVATLPVLGQLATDSAYGAELAFEAGTTALVLAGAMVPLYKPRPRRILDTLLLAQKRIVLAMIALAAIGYFDYTYRLPRATLIVAMGLLLVVLPGWFVFIRRRPREGDERAVIIGDDPQTITDVLAAMDLPVIGYVSPPTAYNVGDSPSADPKFADGGVASATRPLDELECLGGLSRLDEVLVDHDIDTAVLAFAHPDRAEFFGALDTCYEHGVTAKVHREHADSVLTCGFGSEELVDVDLEPWDVQERVLKRAFDIVFATVGLVVLAPVMLVIAAAIKLEDAGPVFYSHERTAAFGDTFTVHKFRSMVPDAEDGNGPQLSQGDNGGTDPRVTGVGRVLRRTHLDEIPQLWSSLVGDMSVVGPRPERPELDVDMEANVGEWRSRWFVKPGLTGLAQIQDATGYDPEEKLRYDVEYIRRQSFWFDLKIVVRQMWQVLGDIRTFVTS